MQGECSGWWLTVLPYAYTINNLSFPYFLHCDDVEYGLRHGDVPLVWNGIQVWHEAPEYRNFPILAYYERMVWLLYKKKIRKVLEGYKELRKECEDCCYVQAAKDIDKRFC